MVNERWQAPGSLEPVRRLLNTRDLSLQTRTFVDRLPDLAADEERWQAVFPGLPRPRGNDLADLTALRADLLATLEGREDTERLNVWLERFPPAIRVHAEDGYLATDRLPAFAGGAPGAIVAAVVDAIDAGTWTRLKLCPDCKLAFYDPSRNRSKVWCGMYAGAEGRACGSIAKVRRWRERQRARPDARPRREPSGASG